MKEYFIEFWFIRHGETIFNKKKLIQGWADSPLTEKGIETSKKIGKFLKNYKFTEIYSSDLKRAIDTANIINENLFLQLNIKKNFRELNTGMAEGDCIEKHLKNYPNSFNLNLYKKVEYGEDWEEVLTRMIIEINEIIKNNKNTKNTKILIVGHSLAIGALVSYMKGDSFIRKINHLDITIFEYKASNFRFKKIFSIES